MKRQIRLCKCGKKVKEQYHNDIFKGYLRTCGNKKCCLGLNKGYFFSKKAKINMSNSHKGQIPYNKGKKMPEITGKNHPRWKGGNCNSNNSDYMKKWFKNKKEKIAGRPCPKQCEICGAIGNIVFDHDHISGEFRGWICMRCNFAIGHARDNSELLEAMAIYIKNFKIKKMADISRGV